MQGERRLVSGLGLARAILIAIAIVLATAAGAAPIETGPRAQCPAERALGAEATQRLRIIVAAGGLDLRRVSCACRPGTEGTRACNYGRLCGTLTAGGKNVGDMLIKAGLARLYPFGSSPGPATWCGGKD